MPAIAGVPARALTPSRHHEDAEVLDDAVLFSKEENATKHDGDGLAAAGRKTGAFDELRIWQHGFPSRSRRRSPLTSSWQASASDTSHISATRLT